jgi:hypothetical protein
MTISVPAGKYTLETAVKDEKSGKFGVARSPFTAAAPPKGVSASSLAVMRSFTPNTRPDASDPFRFEGGTITPTLDAAIRRGPNAMLRLFFTIYADRAAAAKPTVEVEILQSGASLTKSPLQLPDPDAQGRIPYLMTIPAASIPPGEYEVRVVARQAGTSAVVATTVRIEQ